MTLLWRSEQRGTRYEVRRHGSTVRLHSDGVFHSAWNARTGITGRVWDLLLVAGFAAAERSARVLVLGIGGGTALLQYRRFLDPRVLVGVDLDPMHLHIARRFFRVHEARARIAVADARDWVRRWRGPPFDLVVDDLFGHAGGSPERAVPMDGAWARALDRLVARNGVLAANFVSSRDLSACAQLRLPDLASRYASVLRLQAPRDENAVAVYCRRRTTPAELRARVRAVPGLDDRRNACRLAYTARTVC